MKNTLLIILFIAISFSAVAQPNKIDDRLLVKYSLEELKILQSDNPIEFRFINHCIENAFFVGDLSEEKVKTNKTPYKEITIQTLPISNFYSLNIGVLENESQYFIIKGTKKLLMVKSKKHIKRELNN